ncbi:glycosyltransferase involved in cell wall biosynthesis [Sphingomonas naasensis]|uniref:Glycosyltransferase n=1 Tax=Sphingomonas naasensis TaxID=1344951 RepID=A0A4S1WIS8_9SPHN|nr:glycosyltransferase [Sphingomonas naasensis]NIJ22117.1 glycosyltransferase involved in cell wall biosynthesis [Sphingomonas naasensis]TGX42215.1 glycosyltransferase [Sphingomonas naasensis]
MLHRIYSETAQHILSCAQTMRGGGVERALLRMAEGWLRSGRRVTLVLGSDEGPLAAEIPEGIELIRLGDARYSALFRLGAHVRAAAPDLIFCPGNHYSAVAALTRLDLGRACPPIVAKVSNALVRPEQGAVAAWGYRRWLRLHPRFLDHVVAMTPAMAAEAEAEMRMPSDRVSVIANPPAMPRPDAAPVALPAGRYILGVGRLEPQKRWDRLIDALARVADPQVRLVILGEGSLRGALEAQVARLGLAGRVSLPGHAGDPLPALAGAALAVLTSDYEGVPGVLREALSVGTPVISTESSVAVREIVTGPELGDVVARADGDGLVAALNRWLDPAARRPAPVAAQGDSIADYLALFDRQVAARR